MCALRRLTRALPLPCVVFRRHHAAGVWVGGVSSGVRPWLRACLCVRARCVLLVACCVLCVLSVLLCVVLCGVVLCGVVLYGCVVSCELCVVVCGCVWLCVVVCGCVCCVRVLRDSNAPCASAVTSVCVDWGASVHETMEGFG